MDSNAVLLRISEQLEEILTLLRRESGEPTFFAVFLKKVPLYMPRGQVIEILRPYVKTGRPYGRIFVKSGYGFVEFRNRADADRCLKAASQIKEETGIELWELVESMLPEHVLKRYLNLE